MSFFICLFISLSLLIFFFSNRSLGTFFHRFRIPFPFPLFRFRFRIPDSGFRLLVLPVEKLLLFAPLVFSRTLCQTVYKFQARSFDELSFLPKSWTVVLSQVWRRPIFKFCVYKLAEAVRYLKFKWEFVIIGRACLVVLKFKSSLCWRMLCFKALNLVLNFLVLIRHSCELIVSE